jgi:DNA polymerase III subunit beta
MEFNVKRDVFLGGVQRTLGIVDKRTSMPVLNNVLVRAEADRIRIVATDREIGLIADYEAQVVKDGEITLPARKLFEMLREIQGELVHFRKEDTNWVTITCGKVHFRIPGIPAEEFPKIMDDEEVGFIRVDGAMISDMIKKTYFAMSADESRVNLNGVFVRAEKDQEAMVMRMVATDGHRLSIASADPKVEQITGFDKGLIIPRKGITEIRRLVEDKEGPIELGVKKGMCILKKDGIILKVSLIDAEYPDYKRVVPKDKGTLVELDRGQVLHALRRMSVMASERYSGVRIRFLANKMVLNSINPDVGEASDEIEIQYQDGEIEVGFNVRYLLESIEAVDEEQFTLEIRSGLRPAIVKPAKDSGYMCIVMPLKI